IPALATLWNNVTFRGLLEVVGGGAITNVLPVGGTVLHTSAGVTTDAWRGILLRYVDGPAAGLHGVVVRTQAAAEAALWVTHEGSTAYVAPEVGNTYEVLSWRTEVRSPGGP